MEYKAILAAILAAKKSGGGGSGEGSLPAGGTAGQVLMKNSGADYDASWVTLESADSVSY